MKNVKIYTDGSCLENPGKGGWCAILIYNGVEKVISGGEKLTTNNRMELFAVCSALEALNQACEVEIYSDSAYVVNAVSQNWISNWKANGWRTANKSEVKNIDLWQKLIGLLAKHTVTFKKVKGHADDELNNRCDKEARAKAALQ